MLRTLLDVVLRYQQELGVEERTRTADLISLRVKNHSLQGCAQACKSPISKPLSRLWFALRCTVLCSRWYQIGIRNPCITSCRSDRNAKIPSPSYLRQPIVTTKKTTTTGKLARNTYSPAAKPPQPAWA
jgi:hypothetical protein